MATKTPLAPYSRAELKFWQSAFLVAQFKTGARRFNPAGAAHLSAEYASAAVIELRRAKAGTV